MVSAAPPKSDNPSEDGVQGGHGTHTTNYQPEQWSLISVLSAAGHK